MYNNDWKGQPPMTPDTKTKPHLRLTGTDGNAHAIMAACRRAARKAKWDAKQIEDLLTEMTSGDYDHLLQTAFKHFDVT
jgi:hypothetical protein